MEFGLRMGNQPVIEIGAVKFDGSQLVIRGGDPRIWVRADGREVVFSRVLEHGFSVDGVVREESLTSDAGLGFSVELPFRHRVWASIVSVLAALAPAGYYYNGNSVRVRLGGRRGGELDLGRREEWVVPKRMARMVEVWTGEMSRWSLIWVCNEQAFSVFLAAAERRPRSKRQLRALVKMMPECGAPDAAPPADLQERLRVVQGKQRR